MDSKSEGTKRFIQRRGKPIEVSTTFWVVELAEVGSQVIKLHDTLGLYSGTQISLGGEVLEITSVDRGQICITRPLTVAIPSATLLSIKSSAKTLVIIEKKESTQRLRVPLDLVIGYGSIVEMDNSPHVVTDLQQGDSSLYLAIKPLNVLVDWYSYAAPDDESSETDWPSAPQLKLIQGAIEAYQEPAKVSSILEDPGYVSTLKHSYLLPMWLPMAIGDTIKTSEGSARITGIDSASVRNLQTVIAEFSNSVGGANG